MRAFTKFVQKKFGQQRIRGIEIGVQRGDNALSIYESLQFRRLFLVDIWESYQIADKYKEGEFKIANFGNFYPIVINRFGKKTDVTILKETSIEASKRFPKRFFDFIYIDACHSYEALRKDIENWFPKIKIGGVFGGHDYRRKEYPGVKRVVNEFIEGGQYKLYQEDSDWWIKR